MTEQREQAAREVYAQTMEQIGGDARMSIAQDIRGDVEGKLYPVTVAAMLAFSDQEAEQGRIWKPMTDTAWLDGRDVILRAHGMIVSARYCEGNWSEDTPGSPREYDGAVWSCFDDQFQFEIEEISSDARNWEHDPVTQWSETLTANQLASQPSEVRREAITNAAFKALRNYQMTNMAQEDEPSAGYPLVDLCSAGETIADGEEQIGEMAAAVADAILALATPKSAPSPGGDVVLPWANVSELTEWIEGVRTNAFFAGARHDGISRAEAVALLSTLSTAPQAPTASQRVGVEE